MTGNAISKDGATTTFAKLFLKPPDFYFAAAAAFLSSSRSSSSSFSFSILPSSKVSLQKSFFRKPGQKVTFGRFSSKFSLLDKSAVQIHDIKCIVVVVLNKKSYYDALRECRRRQLARRRQQQQRQWSLERSLLTGFGPTPRSLEMAVDRRKGAAVIRCW